MQPFVEVLSYPLHLVACSGVAGIKINVTKCTLIIDTNPLNQSEAYIYIFSFLIRDGSSIT